MSIRTFSDGLTSGLASNHAVLGLYARRLLLQAQSLRAIRSFSSQLARCGSGGTQALLSQVRDFSAVD